MPIFTLTTKRDVAMGTFMTFLEANSAFLILVLLQLKLERSKTKIYF